MIGLFYGTVCYGVLEHNLHQYIFFELALLPLLGLSDCYIMLHMSAFNLFIYHHCPYLHRQVSPQLKRLALFSAHCCNISTANSTCVKGKQFWGICIYIVFSNELDHPSGRYTISLDASKGFEENITQGGVLSMIQWSHKIDLVVKEIGSQSSYIGMYQFLHRIHLLTLKLNVEFALYHPL